jgi:hypothetical protein
MSKSDRFHNFNLFIKFMKGEKKIPDAFYWAISINNKIMAMEILKDEVIAQIPKCRTELEELEINRYSNGIELTKLALKYEVFLNSIYSLCENLGQIMAYLQKQGLSNHFHRQKSKFLKDSAIDNEYSRLVKSTDWYDEVHAMRSETTHYMSGFIVNPTPTTFGYMNTPRSGRADAPKKISIDNVEQHVNCLFNEVIAFLSSFGSIAIKALDANLQSSQICYLLPEKGLLCARIISLREYLAGESGICQTTDVSCPEMDSCIARKKSKS